MLQAILKGQGPLKSPLDIIWPVSIQYVTFKGETMHLTVGVLVQDVNTSWRKVKRFVTSRHGNQSHSRLLERAINKLQVQLYFWYFFIVKDDHGTFFNGRIRFLLPSIRLCIDTGTRGQNENLAFYTVTD